MQRRVTLACMSSGAMIGLVPKVKQFNSALLYLNKESGSNFLTFFTRRKKSLSEVKNLTRRFFPQTFFMRLLSFVFTFVFVAIGNLSCLRWLAAAGSRS